MPEGKDPTVVAGIQPEPPLWFKTTEGKEILLTPSVSIVISTNGVVKIMVYKADGTPVSSETGPDASQQKG